MFGDSGGAFPSDLTGNFATPTAVAGTSGFTTTVSTAHGDATEFDGTDSIFLINTTDASDPSWSDILSDLTIGVVFKKTSLSGFHYPVGGRNTSLGSNNILLRGRSADYDVAYEVNGTTGFGDGIGDGATSLDVDWAMISWDSSGNVLIDSNSDGPSSGSVTAQSGAFESFIAGGPRGTGSGNDAPNPIILLSVQLFSNAFNATEISDWIADPYAPVTSSGNRRRRLIIGA